MASAKGELIEKTQEYLMEPREELDEQSLKKGIQGSSKVFGIRGSRPSL